MYERNASEKMNPGISNVSPTITIASTLGIMCLIITFQVGTPSVLAASTYSSFLTEST